MKDNQQVHEGDILFQIDRDRFALALRQAEAVLAGRQAALELATSTQNRYQQLTDVVVTKEKRDQVLAALQQAQADSQQALADRDLAKLNLARSEVHASVNGTITNMELRPGAYVSAGTGVMALVDSDTLHVDGYFEETKLPSIHVGDPVSIHLMGENQDLTGHVERHRRRHRGPGAELELEPPGQHQPQLQLGAPGTARAGARGARPCASGVQLLSGRTATVVVEAKGSSDSKLASSRGTP